MFVIRADDDGYPRATVQIDGPIISPKVGVIVDPETGRRTWPEPDNMPEDDNNSRHGPNSNLKTMGAAMKKMVDVWPQFVASNRKHFTEAGIVNHRVIVDYTYSGEEEDKRAAQADLSRQKNEEVEARRQRNLDVQRRREAGEVSGDENVDDEEYEEEHYIDTVIPDYIEPWEWTKPIKSPGWYQMCVHAETNTISVEIDIRSSADLGGINRDTGHVYTHDERDELDEEERIMNAEKEADEKREAKLVAEELEKALQSQVRDYDIQVMKQLMNEINSVVNQVQKKQANVHNRIKGHESTARRNYKKIIRNGIVQTVLFLVITLFQLYTIHKWLLSNNTLGRA